MSSEERKPEEPTRVPWAALLVIAAGGAAYWVLKEGWDATIGRLISFGTGAVKAVGSAPNAAITLARNGLSALPGLSGLGGKRPSHERRVLALFTTTTSPGGISVGGVPIVALWGLASLGALSAVGSQKPAGYDALAWLRLATFESSTGERVTGAVLLNSLYGRLAPVLAKADESDALDLTKAYRHAATSAEEGVPKGLQPSARKVFELLLEEAASVAVPANPRQV